MRERAFYNLFRNYGLKHMTTNPTVIIICSKVPKSNRVVDVPRHKSTHDFFNISPTLLFSFFD